MILRHIIDKKSIYILGKLGRLQPLISAEKRSQGPFCVFTKMNSNKREKFAPKLANHLLVLLKYTQKQKLLVLQKIDLGSLNEQIGH